jgi:hypothetical protein
MAEGWNSHGHRKQLAAMVGRTDGVENHQSHQKGAGGKPSTYTRGALAWPLIIIGLREVPELQLWNFCVTRQKFPHRRFLSR